MSPRPNLFIVGAPRCGTTKLHVDLGKHPEIFMPARKEPHFFSTDINEAFVAHQKRRPENLFESMGDYLELFRDAGDAKVVGESSVYYLYSDRAAEAIREFAPEAKILILLRDPVDFLYSLHGRLYSMVDETRPFARALELEAERREGRSLPRTVRYPGLLFYSDYARFSDRILRYRELFGPAQVRVVLLDDLRRDPVATYRDILSFLEVELRDPPADTPTNENMEARSRLLAYCLRLRWLGGKWNRLDSKLERWNGRAAKRRPMDPSLRARLRKEQRPEVETLSRLIGRDLLTLWGYGSEV